MPNGNGIVVKAAKDRGLIAIPGIATPTEAFTMIEAGADALKLFPAEGVVIRVGERLKCIASSVNCNALKQKKYNKTRQYCQCYFWFCIFDVFNKIIHC